MKRTHHAAVFLCALIVLNTGFIWGNSVLNMEDSATVSAGLLQFLQNLFGVHSRMSQEMLHHILRKAAHFTEFFALGALYSYTLQKLPKNKVPVTLSSVYTLFATLLTAVLDEFIQLYTARGSSVKDVLLDFSGALMATVIVHLVIVVKRKKPKTSA